MASRDQVQKRLLCRLKQANRVLEMAIIGVCEDQRRIPTHLVQKGRFLILRSARH